MKLLTRPERRRLERLEGLELGRALERYWCLYEDNKLDPDDLQPLKQLSEKRLAEVESFYGSLPIGAREARLAGLAFARQQLVDA